MVCGIGQGWINLPLRIKMTAGICSGFCGQEEEEGVEIENPTLTLHE